MSNITPISTPNMEFKPKSFWQKPEGLTGGLFLAGIAAVIFYFWGSIVPFVLSTVQNTFWLGIYGIALAAIVYMILDPRMRNLIWFGYKSIMRAITGMFVEIDPIGILKTYVESLEKSLGRLSQQIGVLKGQRSQLTQLMNSNAKEIETNMKLASQAEKQGQESQIVLFNPQSCALERKQRKV